MKRSVIRKASWYIGLPLQFWSFIAVFCFFLSVTSYFFLIVFFYAETSNNIYASDGFVSDEFHQVLFRHFVQRGQEWRMPDEDKRCLESENYTNTACYMNCRHLRKIRNVKYLASGWTKSTYLTAVGDTKFVVKTVNIHGHDMHECLKVTPNTASCYRKAAAKILNEIVYLKQLWHENVLKEYGYCIPYQGLGNKYNSIVMLATEIGQPVDVIRLLQMSWEDRLRVSLDIASLLAHLAKSPLGPAAIRDFRRQQFVMVDGVLKLSDADDLVFNNSKCSSSKDCVVWSADVSHNVTVPCQKGICVDYNEKYNLHRAATQFMNFIISHGAPPKLQPLISEIVKGYQTASWTSSKLKLATTRLVLEFSAGSYRNQTTQYLKGFNEAKERDLPGQFDYDCHLSLSVNECVFSVANAEEAAEMCAVDPNCQAFVITKKITWTGRRIAHFKSDFVDSSMEADATLYTLKVKKPLSLHLHKF